MNQEIFAAYRLSNQAIVIPFGNGLINNTWKIKTGDDNYILQKINTAVFKVPGLIAENIGAIARHLSENFPGYYFIVPFKTAGDKEILHLRDDGYYRLLPFVENSHSVNVAANINEAFEAARKFGEFTRLLSNFPVQTLKITLPDFHNLSLRYINFIEATRSGNKKRIKKANALIKFLKSQENIVTIYKEIKLSKDFKLRVTHHDTKISNILFDEKSKGICVIDLDTLMPGYFISDVGDMIRTYTSSSGEEEKDFSKIEMREDYFIAIGKGYLSEMKNELSKQERAHFVYAGKFMIYMQALRFLTDYLSNDIYYGSKYEDHNLIRAGNQAHLLQLLIEKENSFQKIVNDINL